MNTTTLLIAIVLVAIYLFNRWRKASQGSSQELLRQALAQNALIIDVRDPAEFQTGHYPGALNIPLHQFKQAIDALQASRDRPVILYCASGMRSGMAKRQVEDSGFRTVLNAGSLHNMPPPPAQEHS